MTGRVYTHAISTRTDTRTLQPSRAVHYTGSPSAKELHKLRRVLLLFLLTLGCALVTLPSSGPN
jgi:hypothetical protein